jgi:CHAT domain-containing protein
LPLYKQALAIRREVLGEKHPEYAISLTNLAILSQDLGDHKAALALFKQTLAIHREALGQKHPDYASSLHNLAMFYLAMGDDKAALPLLWEARRLLREVLGERHPDYATCLNHLALLYWARGDTKQAASLSGRAVGVWRRYLEDNLTAFSHRQSLHRLQELAWTLSFHLSASLARSHTADLYEAALVYKGLSASRAAEDRLAARHPGVAPLLADLRLARSRLAAHAARLPADRTKLTAWRQRFDALEATREELEVKLSRASDGFRRRFQGPTAKGVSSSLPRGAALVEFLAYLHGDPPRGKGDNGTSERRLLAWVLRKGRPAAFVQLGPAPPVEQAVRLWRKTAARTAGPDEKAARLLREKVWLPVAKLLGDARLVLLCPDGELSGLPFAALPGDKPGSFLLEGLTFAQLTSGRQLLLDSPADDARGLLALGPLGFGQRSAGKDAGFWPPLPGAALEARQVAGLFTKAFRGEAANLLEGNRADKRRLLAGLLRRPAWLHLATHGYFDPPGATIPPPRQGDSAKRLPMSREAALTFARNPLLVSGLVLAGGNEDTEGGRLTAEEVAGQDLGGVRLAALSACETALGRQAGWQGVQGLQRAFHEAGARNLLASLWSVSDPATSVLMEQFYSRLWQKKLAPPEALRQAQLFVLNQPARVRQRARELHDSLAKRGFPEEALQARGLGKKAVAMSPGGAKGPKRSPVAWWGPWVLSGVPAR